MFDTLDLMLLVGLRAGKKLVILSLIGRAPVIVGVLQGSKLGPILFLLMVNDLAGHSPVRSRNRMYVDNVTIS